MVELDIIRKSKWSYFDDHDLRLEDASRLRPGNFQDFRMVPVSELEISKISGWFQFQTWKFPKLQDASRLRPGNFQDLRIFPRDKSSSLWLLDPFKSLWWDFDDPLMKLSFTTWLSNFNYSRQPSLSEIPAQHLTVNSERRTQWLTHLSQVPYLSACVWTRLDCCTCSESDPLTTSSLAPPR